VTAPLRAPSYARQFAKWRRQYVWRIARHICCSAGVSVPLLGQYCAFALELYRLGDPCCDGRILRALAPELVRRWMDRGLDRDLLRRLVYNLTNVDLANGHEGAKAAERPD
jgi:hypothetical protein